MGYNKCNLNGTTKNSKLCNHIRQIDPLCITQKPKVLIRKNIPSSLVKQDHTPHRARARNGYKRRPPEPSTSLIRITGSDRLGKAIDKKGGFMDSTIQSVHQTSFKNHPKVKTGIKSKIDTSDTDKTWVSQYRHLIIENWEIFSTNTYKHTPSKIRKIDQKNSTSVHTQNKEKSSWKNHSKFPIKTYCPILEGIHILDQNINIHSKPNFKEKIGKSSGKIIPTNNSLKRKTTLQNRGLIHTTQLHSLVKRIKSIHSYSRLQQNNEAFTNKKKKGYNIEV